MYKKLGSLIVLAFFFVAFGMTFSIQSIESRSNRLYVQGSGQQNIFDIQGYIGEKKLGEVVKKDSKMFFPQPDFLNRKFFIKFKKTKGGEIKEQTTSKVKLYNSLDIYAKYRAVRNDSNGKNKLLVTLDTKNDLSYDSSLFSVQINGQNIDSSNISLKDNVLQVHNLDLAKGKKYFVNISIGNLKLNRISFVYKKKQKFNYLRTMRKNDKVLVHFQVDNMSDETVCYQNGDKLDKKKYDILTDILIFKYNIDDIERSESVYSLYCRENNQLTTKRYIDLANMLNIKADKLNIKSSDDKGVYKFQIDGDKLRKNGLKVQLDGQKMEVKENSFNNWKYNLESENKYGFKIATLTGEEKKQFEKSFQKKVDKAKKFLFEFDKDKEKIEFEKYGLSKGKHSIQLITGNQKSLKLEFSFVEDKKSQSFEFIRDARNNNLGVKFESLKNASGTNYQNKTYKLGKLKLLSGNKYDYHIQSLKFDLKLQGNSNKLPIESIKLGNNQGFIKKQDGKYIIEFENIMLKELESKKLNLKVNLSDNFENVGMKIQPVDLSYQFLSAQSNEDKYKVRNMDMDSDQSVRFSSKFVYSPCFDLSDKYKNCKQLGYEDKSRWEWNIGPVGDQNRKDKEKGKKESKSNDSTKKQKKQGRINQKIQAMVDKYVARFVKVIETRADSLKVQKKYYKVFASKIAQIAERNDGWKKQILKGIADELEAKGKKIDNK